MARSAAQRAIVNHYEACFAAHGRSPKGVDWPNQADLDTRFGVMLGLVRPGPRPSVLDLGCGPGLLLDYLERVGRLDALDYAGIELSQPMLAAARERWPGHRFDARDILVDPLDPGAVDYVIMNGVLTERVGVPQAEMEAYALDLLASAFDAARIGIAFNVMSKLVDWERDDLFHWGFDAMARGVKARLARHMQIRADYGLYEYTVYVYRQPARAAG